MAVLEKSADNIANTAVQEWLRTTAEFSCDPEPFGRGREKPAQGR